MMKRLWQQNILQEANFPQILRMLGSWQNRGPIGLATLTPGCIGGAGSRVRIEMFDGATDIEQPRLLELLEWWCWQGEFNNSVGVKIQAVLVEICWLISWHDENLMG
jgi:hypothetical protein